MLPSVKFTGFLNKKTYVICYLSYHIKGQSHSKTYHLYRVRKGEHPNSYQQYAHLLTVVAMCLTYGMDWDRIDTNHLRETLLPSADTVINYQKKHGHLNGHPIYDESNEEMRSVLANAITLYLDLNLPFVTPAEARLLSKQEQVKQLELSSLKYRKDSQLFVSGVTKDNLVECECSCGFTFQAHPNMLRMVCQCKRCNYSDYKKAEELCEKITRSLNHHAIVDMNK